MAQTNQNVAELTKNIERMNQNIDELRNSHQTEHNVLHWLRVNYATEATRNNNSKIAELFANFRGISRFRLRTLTGEECDDLFDDNLDSIDLLDTEGNISNSFPTGDIIAEVSHRRSRDTIFYMAVEASSRSMPAT